MTDKARASTPRSTDKRTRLIEGAMRLIYERGVERTTLADVAARTGVPVGNIYYYFKTKDDLVEAVIGAHSAGRDELLARLERRRSPRSRLIAFLDELDGTRGLIADHGCPIGTLSSELHKRDGTGDSLRSGDLLGSMVDWAERQFSEMGRRDARELAVQLIATYEGATVLTHASGDPDLMHRQSQRLRRWIDTLAETTPT